MVPLRVESRSSQKRSFDQCGAGFWRTKAHDECGPHRTDETVDLRGPKVSLTPAASLRHGAGVNPWRRMMSANFARSGGPPAAAFSTSKASRKYCGPMAAGVITHSTF